MVGSLLRAEQLLGLRDTRLFIYFSFSWGGCESGSLLLCSPVRLFSAPCAANPASESLMQKYLDSSERAITGSPIAPSSAFDV
jgi:hypothetical protein